MTDVYLSKKNLDELNTENLVLTFFQDEKPLKGESGLIDWRLNGFISKELSENRLSGEKNELLLLTSKNKINVKKILMIGLGDENSIDEENIKDTVLKIKKSLSGLNLNSFAFSLSRKIKNEKLYNNLLNTAFSFFLNKNDEFKSIYYHYEKEEEKQAITKNKKDNIRFFEIKDGSVDKIG